MSKREKDNKSSDDVTIMDTVLAVLGGILFVFLLMFVSG